MIELHNERYAIKQLLESRGIKVIWFEGLGARPEDSQSSYLRGIRECNLYVGVYWNEYGNLMESGLSPIEEEYREAQRLRKPCLIYVKDFAVRRDDRLSKFISEIAEKHTYKTFKYANNLAEQVYNDIQTWLVEQQILKGMESVDENNILDIEDIDQLEEEIENETRRIDDFVGRKSIIRNFDPEKPFLVEGKAGIGKTYLLKKLATLHNGLYIPLKRINDTRTFRALVNRAANEGKKLFIDDYNYANEHIKRYISARVWNAVISSRPPIVLRRDIDKIIIPGLEKGDIEEYFEIKGISIEEEILEKLKEDLSLPQKLRVFVNFLKSRNISSLNSNTYYDTLKQVGYEGIHLSEELENWYELFIWRDFEEGRYPRKAKQAFFILSLVRIPINIDCLSQILEVDEETASNIIEALRAFIDYHKGYFQIFHESISNFVKSKIGNSRNLNSKIGDVFSLIPDSRYKWEVLYHYRKAGSEHKFEKIFSLEDAKTQKLNGLWEDALENLSFYEKTKKNKGETSGGEFLIFCGVLLMELGKWSDGLRKLEESLKQFEEEGNRMRIAEIYNYMGYFLMLKGNLKKAEEYYSKSANIFQKIENKIGIAQTYWTMGTLFVNKGELKKAEEYYQKSQELFEKIKGENSTVEIYRDMANLYISIGSLAKKVGKWEKTEQYYQKSFEIGKRIRAKQVMGMAYGNMGLLFADKGEWKKAEEYYKKSLEILEQIGDKYMIARLYGNMGLLQTDKAEWKKAEEYYKRSLEILKAIGDEYWIAKIHRNIGILLVAKGEWRKAEEYYVRSLDVFQQKRDRYGVAQIYGEMGLLLAKKGEWKKAEEYCKKSLKILENLGDLYEIALSHGNLALVYCGEDELDKALSHCDNSFEILEELGDRFNLARAHRIYGIIYRKRGELKKSKEQFEKSVKIYQKISALCYLAEMFLELALTLIEMGDKRNAEKYLTQALEIFSKFKVEYMIEKLNVQLEDISRT